MLNTVLTLGIVGITALAFGFLAAMPRQSWIRAVGLACLALALIVSWIVSLGRVRPQMPWLPPVEGRLLAYLPEEPSAIALWILPKGAHEPLAMAIPWSREQAQKLQDLSRFVKKNGGDIYVKVGSGFKLKSKIPANATQGRGNHAGKQRGGKHGPKSHNGYDWLQPYPPVNFDASPPSDQPDKEEVR